MGHRQHALWHKDQADADKTITAFHGGFDFLFPSLWRGLPIQGTLKYIGYFSGPNRLLCGKLSNFLGDLSVDDVFRNSQAQPRDGTRFSITDDVEKLTEQSRKLQTVYQSHWRVACEYLTFFYTITFCRYLALLDGKMESQSKIKNEGLLFHLDVTVFGQCSQWYYKAYSESLKLRVIGNWKFHAVTWSNFELPPRNLLQRRKSLPNFESHCGHRILHHSASSVEQRTALKAWLADFAHLYCDSTIDSHGFTMHKECFLCNQQITKEWWHHYHQTSQRLQHWSF